MTNVTRTLYRNTCNIKLLQDNNDGSVSVVSEQFVEYIDTVPFDPQQAIKAANIIGPAITSDGISVKVLYGMTIDEFIEHGHVIK